MFDHRAILCSIRVINSRCDILLDRSVVTHDMVFRGVAIINCNSQYTVFCLLTVYLIVSSLYRSDDSIYHAKCVFFVMYCFMQSVYCLNSRSTRLGFVVVVQRNDKNTQAGRNYLLCNTVAAGVMNLALTFSYGVKVDRPLEVN